MSGRQGFRGWSRPATLAGLLAVGVLVGWGGEAAASAATGPEPAFGTAPVAGGPATPGQATVTAVRVGRHAGFDRVVFETSGPALRYQVGYEPRLVEDPTGRVLPLAGSAVLTVTLHGTRWTQTPSPRVNRTDNFPALRQVRSAGEFEAVASYGLGQAGRDGFRVFRLTGPDRIVVDLRHPAGTAEPSAGASSGTGTGTAGGASADPTAGTAEPAGASNPAAAPTGTTQPAGGTSPLPIIVVAVLVAGLLAAGGIVLRAR